MYVLCDGCRSAICGFCWHEWDWKMADGVQKLCTECWKDREGEKAEELQHREAVLSIALGKWLV